LAAARGDVEASAAVCRDQLQEAAATRARRLAAVSSLYVYAVDTGVLSVNPVAAVKRPKVSQDHSPTLGLTADQGRAVLAAGEAESPRTGALVALLLLGALRVSEACAARAEHLGVDRGHRVLTVHGKGGTARQLALVPRLAHALDVQLAGRDTGFVLVTRTGRPWDRAEAWRAVRRIATRAGVPHADRISPHSLRHTAATLALEAGAPLHRVQDLLGHADPRTTRRYDRRRKALDGHAAYTLGQALA
ncbi:MAG: tyrosine-type recombinase/integrase, partial [Streptomycetaceae bacterium]|nr:tyrosine-type recombinase/integrase [Streptomycetaceae bacterium]